MTTGRLEQQLRFLVEIDKLKAVIRQTFLTSVDRKENSAEHSWHLALLAVVLEEYADESIDLLRVIKMVLVHDLIEIGAGDTFVYDQAACLEQAKRESKASEELFDLLPADQRDELKDIWFEFNSSSNPESRFAQALDRLMPFLHNYFGGGRTWQANGVRSNQVLSRNEPIDRSSHKLWEAVREMISDATRKGLLAEG